MHDAQEIVNSGLIKTANRIAMIDRQTDQCAEIQTIYLSECLTVKVD